MSPSAAAPSAPEPAPKRQFGRSARAGAVAAVVLAAGGAYWIASPPTKESTDNAYTAADATSVAPRVRGLVAQVLVHDNQAVRAGAPLVRIDAEEFDAKVASARANLADAEADVASARAALRSLDADEALARASMAAARTDIRSASAQAQQAAADRRRYEALADSGSVSRHDAEVYRTAAVTAEQGAARAQALLAVSGSEASVTSARRPVLLAALQKAEAKRLQARAGLDLALQDQRHALIVAPIEGVVGNRRVRVGDYVEAGTRLLNVVPLQAIYVTANFKETQVRYMRVGQRAKVHVDALGQTLAGRVESLAPGSGSTFSLLPFEPGTGNFTKIVQRIPVRISLDPGQKGLADLRPGLSVTATVRFDADR
ncbi:transporter [Sphingobium sp. 22B]|nr:transporter [Sphingobium sp. AM]KYC32801.1 transporter [Sphingobium sp. 22B]OAP31686.1 transporter [Sphingobium sp. 20006FA]